MVLEEDLDHSEVLEVVVDYKGDAKVALGKVEVVVLLKGVALVVENG